MRITEENFKSEYIIRTLGEDENVKTFSCGDEDLDDFILNESAAYTKAMISATHVVINKKSYPAVKLCRLGIATSEKGKGLGSLLLNMLFAMFCSQKNSGCRFVTVDAYKTAVPFYEKNGFDLLTKKESRSDTLPLYFDLASF